MVPRPDDLGSDRSRIQDMGDLLWDIVGDFVADTLPALLTVVLSWLCVIALQLVIWVKLFQLADRGLTVLGRSLSRLARALNS
jgi:hypothetical protein